jgi:sialate O-acetylesterase
MWLAPVNDQSAIMPLTGDWPYKIEHKLTTVNLANAVPPTSLYNGMIHPLAGLPISGFTWYQGESNTGRAHLYQTLLATMIRSWRNAWGQGDLPFLIVQLAGFSQPDDHGASSWAELREAQRLVSLSEPRCGLACTIDIGEPDDIHPSNKLDVGLRLAMEALHVAYGHDDVERSPTYRSHAVHGHEVKVQFERGDTLEPIDSVSGFSLAGEDQKFYPAEARVEGNAVVVRSEAVTTPVAVRYGWRGFPDCNLRTRSGLPVLPFRSDDWPWTTQGAR